MAYSSLKKPIRCSYLQPSSKINSVLGLQTPQLKLVCLSTFDSIPLSNLFFLPCSFSGWMAPWPKMFPAMLFLRTQLWKQLNRSTSRRIYQLTALPSHQGILYSNEHTLAPAVATTWMCLRYIILPHRSKSQKVAYCVKPFKRTKTKAELNRWCKCTHVR